MPKPPHRSPAIGLSVLLTDPWLRRVDLDDPAFRHERAMAAARGEPDPLARQWVPLGPRHRVPHRFIATLTGEDPRYPACTLDIEHRDERFVCTRVELTPRRGTDDELRLPLAKLVREAVALAAGESNRDDHRLTSADYETLVRDETARRRVNGIPRDEVVEVYTRAYKLGLHPRKAVQERFSQYPANTVKRWVQTVRREGLLPATRERVAKA